MKKKNSQPTSESRHERNDVINGKPLKNTQAEDEKVCCSRNLDQGLVRGKEVLGSGLGSCSFCSRTGLIQKIGFDRFVRLVGLFGMAFSIIAFGDMLTWARWWCLWICPSRCVTSFAQRRSVRTAFRLNFRGSQGSLLRGGGGYGFFSHDLISTFPY